MKEFIISDVKAETAVLVGLITKEQDEAKTKEYLDELEFLADTAGAVTVKRFTQRVNGPSAVTYVGKGKLEEIKEYIKQGQFAPGSMLPKVEAAIDFVTNRPEGKAVITSLSNLGALIESESGTIIVKD